MPADLSSSIPPGLTQLAHGDQLRPGEPPDLLAYLAAIDDPRTRAGRCHPLAAILAMAAAAVLTGAQSMTAIASGQRTPAAGRRHRRITTGGRLAHLLKDAIEWECRQSVKHLRG